MDPRIGRRRAAVIRARGRRRLRVLLAALAVAALASGALVVLHSPLLSARHLQVVGAVHVPATEVLAVAGVGAHPPLVDVNAGAAETRLEALAWVKTALVRVSWPDSVRIVVVERRPAAVVAGSGAEAGRWALVDDSGRVLAWRSGPLNGLPQLVSAAPAGAAGRHLGRAAGPGLAVVGALPGQLPVAPRTIVVAPDGTVTLALADGVQARLGRADSLPSKLAALRSVLLGAPPSGPEVVDVTVPAEPTVAPAAVAQAVSTAASSPS